VTFAAAAILNLLQHASSTLEIRDFRVDSWLKGFRVYLLFISG
jgi:hypothetical protein